jgi:RNA-directed DNA polymerase
MRQNIQLKLAFVEEGRSEAPPDHQQGSEAPPANCNPERATSQLPLMEEICAPENLRTALKRVQANRGSPGIDRRTTTQLPAYLKEHWPTIRQQLLDGTYRPQPVKRVEIPKPDGGTRKLGIPTVLDRFIQQAVAQVLQSHWDATFSDHSYGFRPGRSAQQALAQAQEYITEGYTTVVDIDLEKFFDRVNHDVLMGLVSRRVEDKRVRKLIRAFLTAGVMEGGLVSPSEEGTPQGGPLSPLLSNLMLHELDKELEKRGHRFCRYADDCNIYVKSERAGQRVMESISSFITRKLKLRVNTAKSAVGRAQERGFLGFRFLITAKGVKRRIAPKAIKRFKMRVRELTRRTRGQSARRILEELRAYLQGWKAYFCFCQTPSVLKALDSWIRRRLRSRCWKQWKTFKNRCEQLKKRGVNANLAAFTAGSQKGAWALSQAKAMLVALPTAYFRALGVPELAG